MELLLAILHDGSSPCSAVSGLPDAPWHGRGQSTPMKVAFCSSPQLLASRDHDASRRAPKAALPSLSQVLGKAEAATVVGAWSHRHAIGLKVSIRVKDALCPSGDVAQQAEGAHARARRAQHLGSEFACLFQKQHADRARIENAIEREEGLNGDEDDAMATIAHLAQPPFYASFALSLLPRPSR